MIPVGTTVSGTIDAFLADVGQEVFEGQLLARIANQGLEAAQQEAARAAQNVQEKVSSIENRVIAARLEAWTAEDWGLYLHSNLLEALSIHVPERRLLIDG